MLPLVCTKHRYNSMGLPPTTRVYPVDSPYAQYPEPSPALYGSSALIPIQIAKDQRFNLTILENHYPYLLLNSFIQLYAGGER